MKRTSEAETDPDMADEYDFSGGVRGKYVDRFPPGSKIVVIAPDNARLYRDSAAVNRALRKLSKLPNRGVARKTSKGKRKAARVKGNRG